MIKYIVLFFLFQIILGCNRDDYSSVLIGDSKIVVEGFIEEGDFPQVILMRSIPVDVDIDSAMVMSYVIRSAKVVVSDGINEEVLQLKSDKNRVPPYVYYGSELKGEAGKTYNLKIQFLNYNIESVTTIPQSVPVKEVKYYKDNPLDSLGNLSVKFEDNPSQKNYYQILTKVEYLENIFIPSFYGNLDDSKFVSSNVTVQINRGIEMLSKYKYNPYFNDGDLISVKLRTSQKPAYDFWNDWQNEVLNGKNPIFPSTFSLKSNIKGGIGLWAGYGQSVVLIRAI